MSATSNSAQRKARCRSVRKEAREAVMLADGGEKEGLVSNRILQEKDEEKTSKRDTMRLDQLPYQFKVHNHSYTTV